MPEKKLNDLFQDTLKDIYFAERQILSALPKLAKVAQSEELRNAFMTHRDETEGHVQRLEEVFKIMGTAPEAKTCESIKGILKEGEEIEISIAGKHDFKVARDQSKERALEQLRQMKWSFPPDFKFDRDEINGR